MSDLSYLLHMMLDLRGVRGQKPLLIAARDFRHRQQQSHHLGFGPREEYGIKCDYVGYDAALEGKFGAETQLPRDERVVLELNFELHSTDFEDVEHFGHLRPGSPASLTS